MIEEQVLCSGQDLGHVQDQGHLKSQEENIVKDIVKPPENLSEKLPEKCFQQRNQGN